MSEHTPTPWEVQDRNLHGDVYIARQGEADWKLIVMATDMLPPPVAEANAAHIVRCVNSHADLLAMLKVLLADMDHEADTTHFGESWYEVDRAEARATIRGAEGEA